MLNEASQKGIINKETVIIEPTSGNTGNWAGSDCRLKRYEGHSYNAGNYER